MFKLIILLEATTKPKLSEEVMNIGRLKYISIICEAIIKVMVDITSVSSYFGLIIILYFEVLGRTVSFA